MSAIAGSDDHFLSAIMTPSAARGRPERGLCRDRLHLPAHRAQLGEPSQVLGQGYARLLLDEVSVTHEEIRISGSKAVLARAATHDADIPAPAVLSFVSVLA
jgi:hypothetical protein